MKTHCRIISCMIALMMFVGMLSVFSVSVVSADRDSATITLTMSDSYGDGWNGNAIEVYVNGVSSGRYTVSSGSSATHSISYDSTNTYEFKWVKGSYASECSFTIQLNGEILLSATKTQCGNLSNNYSLLIIESVQEEEEEEIECDLEGEFAGGSGTTADPYLVATKAQLNNVRKYPTAHFRQVRNIVFTASDFGMSGDFYNDGCGWEPIGVDYNTGFGGTYDGNRYSIDGLTITADASQYRYIGLFGYVYGDIVNVKLTNICYTATGYSTVGGVVADSDWSEIIGCSVTGIICVENGVVGGIAGYAYKVEHCRSNVSIDVVGTTNIDAGGIVGSVWNSIRYCKNNGNITIDGDADASLWVGGICSSTGNSDISDCQNNGNITISGDTDMYVCVGGITGSAYNDITRCENNGTLSSCGSYVRIGGITGEFDSHVLSECVNRGNISAVYPTVNSYVGGIVGEVYGYEECTVLNCYVTDTVTLTARGTSLAVAGGIAGYVDDVSSITNCYSLVNSVTVNTSASGWGIGGIAGHNYGTVSKCYYRYTYGVGYGSGSFSASRYSSLSSYESKSTYSGFDFTSVWQMGAGIYEYAALRMESGHTHSLTYNAATVTHESAGNLENWYCAVCQTYFRNSAGTRYVTTDMLEADPLPREGKCGTDVTWKLNSEGELTISGSGKMDDYTDENPAPWYVYRESVKIVTVNRGVTGIGSKAFKGCVNLTKVALVDGIETIGDGAFSGCSNITKLRIPEGVISVGDKAFSSISNLIVCFEGGAPYFGGSNVFLSTLATVYYPSYDNTWTAEVMQGQTGSITWTPYTSIDDIIVASGSLYSYGNINWSFSLSGKLTIIGQYSSMDLPDYDYSSPAWASYKNDITSIELVNISRIGKDAFYKYPVLKSINFGTVEEVGAFAFYGCSALENVFLEDFWGDITIEKYAFSNCSSLTRVAFPKNTVIEDYAFSMCPELDEIYITTYSDYGGTPMWSSNGFYGVTATVYVPINWGYFKDYGDFGGSLTWKEASYGPCGSNAFWTYDSNTATITITGTGSIASYYVGSVYPWYGLCSDVTKVVFEDGVTYIPRYVFEYMKNVQTVTLPNTLQKLAGNAFNGCKSLNNLVIPASLTAFEDMSYFNRCDSLTDVYYMGTAQEWNNIENNTVVGGAYDYVSSIHYLVLTDQVNATCTTNGTEAYYQFDDTSVYSDYYNLDRQPIMQPEIIPALGHSYNAVVTAPTCTENGYTTYTCHCGDNCVADEVAAFGHTEVIDAAIAPTCTETGLTEGKHCSVCDQVLVAQEMIVANGHTEVIDPAVDATCTQAGLTEGKHCSVCSVQLISQTIIAPLGHSYTATVIAPTCNTKGYTSYVCHCGNFYDDEYVSALGHDEIIHNAKEATCTEIGWNAYVTCSRCEYSTYQELTELGHDEINNSAKEPTCTEIGWDAYVNCSRCDYSTYVEKAALGHTYAAMTVPPTCAADGYTTHTCSRCDDSYVDSTVGASGHTEVVDDAVAPTCITSGLTEGKHCSVCNEVLVVQEIIDALGHTEVIDQAIAPTCTVSGLTEGKHCSVCDQILVAQEVVPALGHTATIDEAVAPTCTKTGLTEGAHCSVCSAILVAQEIVNATGHNHIPVITNPTCTQKGYTTYTCHCGSSYVESFVNALGHTMVIDEAIAPTCTEPGLTAGKHCSVCNEILVAQTAVPATGHDYDAVVTDPTCTAGGYTTYTCSICDDSYVGDETAALGHTEIVDAAVAPTCTATGLTAGKHCSVCDEILVAQTVVPATGHTAGETVVENEVAADCENIGSYDNAIYCSICDAELSRNTITVDALGHTEVIDVAVTATCTTTGLTEGKHCSVCNAVLIAQTVVDALGHTEVIDAAVAATCANTGLTEGKHCAVCLEVLVVQKITPVDTHHDSIITAGYMAPTCTEDGLTDWIHCSRCNTYLQEQETIPALGHKYDDEDDRICNVCGYFLQCQHNTLCDGIAIEPTCNYPGLTAGKFCADCGDIVEAQEVIPAVGHDYSGEWTVDVQPTCTTKGSKSHHCTRCDGKTDITEIPANGHSWGNWTQVKAPTCTEKGSERRACANCDHFEERQVDAMGHNDTLIVTAPTCTEKGYTTHVCSRCNEGNYVDSYVDALGHNFTNYTSNNDATYTEDGTKTAKCDCCEVTDTVVDTGSALGMAQKFRDEMAELNQDANTETTYGELYAVLQTYATLSAEEKEIVTKEFATLQQMINAYNAKAQTVNNELADATEIALAPIAATSFAFLAALWFVLRKKFLV